jgi:hypothetical protein
MGLRLKCGLSKLRLMEANEVRPRKSKHGTAAILITGLAILLLQGCVTMPKFTEYEKRLAPATQGYGRIWFYRESRFFGSARHPSIFLNGKEIGKAVPGGYFYLDRPPGNYLITTEQEQTQECRLVLEPGSTRYVRFTFVAGVWMAQMVPQEVSRMTALKELADL